MALSKLSLDGNITNASQESEESATGEAKSNACVKSSCNVSTSEFFLECRYVFAKIVDSFEKTEACKTASVFLRRVLLIGANHRFNDIFI